MKSFGELAESIDKLYIELGLVYYSLNKLKNRKWDVVAKAITELTQFQVKGIQDIVMKKVNHPKKEVRKEIQLYLVQLFSFQGLDFLSVLKTPLSRMGPNSIWKFCRDRMINTFQI